MDTVRARSEKNPRIPNILSIAGSDPSGGAGIQADIKSISANGGYAMAVLTALTAQNTRGVTGVHTPPLAFLREQLDAVAVDVTIDAVKIGMLGSAGIARCIAEWLDDVRPPVVVLDPVMVATSGARLLDDDAVLAVVDLARRASLVTPNIPELAVLVGAEPAASWPEALDQGTALAARLGTRVLVKGGHLPGERCPDALVLPPGLHAGTVVLDGQRIATTNTHGTGCSLSSAIATRYAVTADWATAVREAKSWLAGALAAADQLDVGAGNGPVHHFHAATDQGTPEPFTASAWRDTAAIRQDILDLPFLSGLTDGSLSTEDFAYYLQQDGLYLREYCGVLARTAAMAPSEDEQLFWLGSATSCLRTEAELHRTWLAREAGTRFGEGEAGSATRAYCDHLTATAVRGSYAELVAAVLPCFWLYAAVGDRVQEQVEERRQSGLDDGGAVHPYGDWIGTYADPVFAAATERAKQIADGAYRRASAGEREAMLVAFRRSAVHEREFFDAPRARRRAAVPREPADLQEDAVLA